MSEIVSSESIWPLTNYVLFRGGRRRRGDDVILLAERGCESLTRVCCPLHLWIAQLAWAIFCSWKISIAKLRIKSIKLMLMILRGWFFFINEKALTWNFMQLQRIFFTNSGHFFLILPASYNLPYHTVKKKSLTPMRKTKHCKSLCAFLGENFKFIKQPMRCIRIIWM